MKRKNVSRNRSRKLKEDIETVINMLKSKNKEIKKRLTKSTNNLKAFKSNVRINNKLFVRYLNNFEY